MTSHVGNSNPLFNDDFPLFLAPMTGITDLPFRSLVSSFGAGLVVSEMVACRNLLSGSAYSRQKIEIGVESNRTAVQLVGREAYWMAEAARMAEASGANSIDINMGCPARKIVSGYSGSALLQDLNYAESLIHAVVKSVKIPVSLKTRLGWDYSSLNAVELAKRAEEAGIAMITIHGRTRCQFFRGQSNWSAIREIKNAVEIPVVANGDIVDIASARKALELSSADGLMIGRGARGKPWILAEIGEKLFKYPKIRKPPGSKFREMVESHYETILSFYGNELGIRVARKHLAWYMDTALTKQSIRKAILNSNDPHKVLNLLAEAFNQEAVV